ncbi:Mss4-like protein [Aspergillus crustosus]
MAIGSCLCGKIRVESTDEPVATGLCHCADCRKISGSLFTYSCMFKRTDIKITGNAKEIATTADSGNRIKNFFCPDCGTPLYAVKVVDSGEPSGILILRGGIFDDIEFLNKRRPSVEVFVRSRVSWVCPLAEVDQFDAAMPLPGR